MAIVSGTNSVWFKAYGVNFLYCILGVASAFSGTVFSGVDHIVPMIDRLSSVAADPVAVKAFYSEMWITFVPFLLLLCISAPVRLVDGERKSQLFSSLCGFIFFGTLLTPGLIYLVMTWPDYLFFGGRRFVRITSLMVSGPIGVGLVGGVLMSSLLWLCWISYCAIPVSIYKLFQSKGTNK